MIALSMESVRRLHSLNIFKDVSLNFDTVKDNEGNVSGSEVCFIVKECSRILTSLSASAGTQSGDAVSNSYFAVLDWSKLSYKLTKNGSTYVQSVSFSLRNLFGRAEQLRAVSTAAFPHWGNTFQLEFTKPYYANIEKK